MSCSARYLDKGGVLSFPLTINTLNVILSRQFCCDELGLKRSASYPLINSDSFQLATTEGKVAPHNIESFKNLLFILLKIANQFVEINLFFCNRPRNAACRGNRESLSSKQKGV